VLSRMLAGLQASGGVFTQPGFEGCVPAGCSPLPSPEQGFFNFLAAFFAGTRVGDYYGAAVGNNNSTTFTDAPINYLQIYWTDFTYAAGLKGCTDEQIMMAQSELDPALDSCRDTTESQPTLVNGKPMTAQEELDVASWQIRRRTAEPAVSPH